MRHKITFAFLFAALAFTFLSCQKETTVEQQPYQKPPIVDAGSPVIVVIPATSTSLTGSATSSNGPITGYLWSLISGPNVPVIQSPSSVNTNVSSLILGTYKFQFMAIDSAGLTGIDTVSVVVQPFAPLTLSIVPQNNPDEVFVDGYTPNTSYSGSTQLTIAAWTAGGNPYSWRAFIKFNMSSIPSNAIIQNAKLSLYSTPTPGQGNGTDAQSGTDNAAYIQRVTSNWATNTITWSNQPTTITTHQVTVPQSSSTTEDNINMDVTSLVQDIVSTNNYGFGIKLKNEVIYNARQYASSFNTNVAKRPTLVVTYTLP